MIAMPEITEEHASAFQSLLRKARGNRTQQKVAEEAGVSQQLVSSLERGPTPGIRALELFQLLQFYGIPPNIVAGVLGYYTFSTLEERIAKYPDVMHALDTLPPEHLEYVMNVIRILVQSFRTNTLPVIPGMLVLPDHNGHSEN